MSQMFSATLILGECTLIVHTQYQYIPHIPPDDLSMARLGQVHVTVCVAPLGIFYSRSDRETVYTHYYDRICHAALL